MGESGIAGPGADLTRLTLHEVTHGERETLHWWLQLDDGHNLLAIVSAPTGALREHTPGELAAQLRQDPDTDDAQLTGANWPAGCIAATPTPPRDWNSDGSPRPPPGAVTCAP